MQSVHDCGLWALLFQGTVPLSDPATRRPLRFSNLWVTTSFVSSLLPFPLVMATSSPCSFQLFGALREAITPCVSKAFLAPVRRAVPPCCLLYSLQCLACPLSLRPSPIFLSLLLPLRSVIFSLTLRNLPKTNMHASSLTVFPHQTKRSYLWDANPLPVIMLVFFGGVYQHSNFVPAKMDVVDLF